MSSRNSGPASPNSGKRMSPEARARMRATEKAIYRYYNDMGKNKGNCTWGVGILAHKGVCSQEELGRKVSANMVDQEFERRVAEAERYVHIRLTAEVTQEQFDALVSLTYNVGVGGMDRTYAFVNRGDFQGAADNISKMIKVTVVENGKKKLVTARGLIRRREEESAPFRVDTQAAAINAE
jgi:lysozyme